MFKRLLIANRGEIALRIQRTCCELGIKTVAVYTKVDADLLHLSLADEMVCIGERSYLDARSIVVAARNYGCDAIHPGYGFLAENSEFAELTEAEGISFIGPDPATIASMGNKSNARAVAGTYGLTRLAGSSDVVEDVEQALVVAGEVGYPLMVKAAHGGGGRGIRIVQHRGELERAFYEAQGESMVTFSSGDMYIEKFLDRPRHIEVQIFGDGAGNAIHLGSRECSIQRRHQKLIEEAPAINIPPEDLQALQALSVKMARGIRYRNAGTMEFLYQDGAFYFIEMNTRLQVEHPVTECITGVDLVRLQIEIAASGQLNLALKNVVIRGHAIECRINAEDEYFNPCPGFVVDLKMPGGPGVRVDSHLYSGYRVPHQYDSLIAKMITFDITRDQAVERMQRALSEFTLKGIANSAGLCQRIMDHPGFRDVAVDTNFLERELI